MSQLLGEIFAALILGILFPASPKETPVDGLVESNDETVPYKAKTTGHLILGEPGSGKTMSQARQFVDNAIAHPNDAFVALDVSGPFSDDILGYASIQKKEVWEWLKKRIMYIRLGDKEYSFPNPEFSVHYGTTYEEQINRVSNNISNLTGGFESASIVGGVTLKAVLPYFLRLLVSMAHVTPYKEPFQITELQLLTDYKNLLSAALTKGGESVDPRVKEFLTTRILNAKKESAELRTYALSELYAAISSEDAIADLGYYYPVWTPKEVIEKGMIAIFDARELANQKFYLNYRMTQIYSLFAEYINKRNPHDPSINQANIDIDEVIQILKNPGIAEEIEEMISMRRSRKVALTVMIQTLSQLSEELQKTIFLMQNITCFAGSVMSDMEVMSKQLFTYNPGVLKPTANEVSEPNMGQDRYRADWLQNLPNRACVVKCRKSESEKDPNLYYVKKTQEVPKLPKGRELEDIKQELMRKIGIKKREALIYPQERMKWLSEPPKRPTA